MDNETETNFGWWTDKPDRRRRAPGYARNSLTFAPKREAVWAKSALIIALVIAFSWALKSLAGWPS